MADLSPLPPDLNTRTVLPDLTLGNRIRVLASAQLVLAFLILGFNLLLGDPVFFSTVLILLIPGTFCSIALYLLRNSRYAVPAVYVNLTVMALLVALGDPISGQTGGEIWVLFQIWPPMTFLTLRRSRLRPFVAVIPLLLLVSSALASIFGLVPVALLAPVDILVSNLIYQVLTLLILSAAFHWISVGEERALAEAVQARARLKWELDTVQALAAEKDRLNATLEERVVERSAVAEQRAAELAATADALQRQTGILQSVLNSMGDGVIVTNADGRLLMYNPAALTIFGPQIADLFAHAQADDMQLYRPDQITCYLPDELPTSRALQGEAIDAEELIIQSADQPARWLSITARPLRSADEVQIGSVAVVRDITSHREAAAALQASEERYALASHGANDGLWDWDFQTNTIFFSPRWKAMLGYRESEISTSPDEWLNRLHPVDQKPVQIHLTAHTHRLVDRFEIEYRIAHRNGGYRWMLCRGLAVWDATGQALRMVGSQTDITDRKQAEERLRHAALHDALTGLPNRALFMERLASVIEEMQATRHSLFAVLFIDLDRFKTINDSLGHLIGDHMLIAVAHTLERCLRPGDTVARLGGDEFTVLLDPLIHLQDAIAVAERIQQALSVPINLDGHEVFSSASIGIAPGSLSYRRPEDVLRDADAAMYQAKLRGKARYVVFDSTMHAEAMALLQLDSDLRRALERHELRLSYQPIISLSTNRVVGFEALIRWQHPERSLLLPADFLHLAEETGVITVIGQWVLREACRQLAEWQSRIPTLPILTISVNLSAKQLAHPDLVEQIAIILCDTGLFPHQLVLDIVERTLNQVPNLATTLEQLKKLGVRLSLDDFGTGYAALGYLHHFPTGTLKIDRSFISRLTDNQEYIVITTAIIAMARALGLDVVAEGIETLEQRQVLEQLQCDCGQGWFFAHPLDSRAVEAFLQTQRSVYTNGETHGRSAGT